MCIRDRSSSLHEDRIEVAGPSRTQHRTHPASPLRQVFGSASGQGRGSHQRLVSIRFDPPPDPYAASDVAGLVDLSNLLDDRLAEVGKSDLYAACCAFLPAQSELTVKGYPDVFAY